MVKLPRAEQKSIYSPADMPHLVGEGWTAPGRALQGLGKAIGSLGAALQDAEDYVDPRQLQEAKLAQLEFINNWNRDELEFRASYTGDGKDYGQTRSELFEQRSQDFMNQWPEPVRRRLAIPQERFRGSVQQDTYQFGYQRYNDTLYSNTGRAITGEMGKFASYVEDDERLNLYRENPDQFSADLEAHIQSLDAIIDGLPLAESRKDQLRNEAAKQLEDTLSRLPAGVTLGTARQQIERFSTPRGEAKPDQAGAPDLTLPERIEFLKPPLERKVGRPRRSPIKGVVLHQTWGSDTMEGNGSWSNKKGTGANYYIDKQGRVYQWAPDDVAMGHIGKGRNHPNNKRPDFTNDNTIGIEIMTRPNERPNEKQIAAARALVLAKAKEHGFSVNDVFGHGELTSPSHRRSDEAIEAVNAIRGGEQQVAKAGNDNQSVRVAALGQTDTATDAAPTGVIGTSSGEVRVAAEGGRPADAQAYRGSVANHLADRLIAKLPALEKQYRAEVAAQVKSVADRAARGEPPPADEEEAIRTELGRLNDDELTTAFETALAAGRTTAQFKQLPPAALETLMLQMRAGATAEGTSAAMSAQLAAMEKLHDTMVKELEANPLGWAVESGVLPGLAPLAPTPEALEARALAAKTVAEHYGSQYFRAFTPDERSLLAETLNNGGPEAALILTGITQAFGQDTPRVMAEFTKDAPEAALLGWLIYAGGDSSTIKDATDALALRRSEGFKPVAPSQTVARATAIDVIGTAFQHMPKNEQYAIDLANLLYEVRARRAGKAAFDAALWKQGLNEALGANTDPATGITYGGIAYNNPNWLFPGGSDPFIAPSNVDAARVRELLDAIRITDLVEGGMPVDAEVPETDVGTAETAAALGVQRFANIPALTALQQRGLPVDDRGRPVSISTIRRARLVTVGDGKYFLAMGGNDNPQYIRTPTGENYVLDLKALEPVLSERRPDLYRWR